MTLSEFGMIITQIETYCNVTVLEATSNAYKAALLHRDFEQMREALELAYIGGYLNEYVKKRVIPSPSVFDQFYQNIKAREEKQPQPEPFKKSSQVLLFIYITQMAFDARKPARKEHSVWANQIYQEWQRTKLHFLTLIESIYATAEESKRQDVKDYVAEIAEAVRRLHTPPAEAEIEPAPENQLEPVENEPLF